MEVELKLKKNRVIQLPLIINRLQPNLHRVYRMLGEEE